MKSNSSNKWTKYWNNPNDSNVKYKFNRPTFIRNTFMSIYIFFKRLIDKPNWHNDFVDIDDQELLHSTHNESRGTMKFYDHNKVSDLSFIKKTD